MASSRDTPKTSTRLEHFCELATSKAREQAGRRDLDYAPADQQGFWHFHCPLPGPQSDPHGWSGGPQAWVRVVGGVLQAGCSKCGSGRADPTYLAQVLEAIGFTDNVERPEFGQAIYRHHEYETSDGRWSVRHTKIIFKDRRKNPIWQWSIRDLSAGAFSAYQSFKPTEFCAEYYQELKHFYLALKLYEHERFIRRDYRVVVTEGERDADTFNELMTAAGDPGLIATCLPIQQINAISPHQRAVLEGRDVILLGDADGGGQKFTEHWGAVLWGVASTIRIFPPELLGLSGDGKDLTDSIEQQETAGRTRAVIGARLIEQIAGLPVVQESMARRNWRAALAVTKNTGATRDSAGNAKIVLTEHPELAGRLRFNLRSGEVEAEGVPWGDTVGAQQIATDAAIWLEANEQVYLKPKSFEEACTSRTVAPAYDPLTALTSTAWDGVPRLDGLFIHYLHLDLAPGQAVQLARLFMSDLVATLHNELVRQRVIIGIATDLELDVAGALLGRHGVQYHGGTVRERQVAIFASEQAALVQIGMTTIGDRQVARFSLPNMFTPFARVGHRQISSPVFLALGERPAAWRTEAKCDERCLVLDLSNHAIDALAADARQVIAEGMARAADLAATPVLVRSGVMTADAREARAIARTALEIIYDYAVKEPAARSRMGSGETVRRHVVRSLCLTEMRGRWANAWRDTPAQERAFNAACRAMGWFKASEKVALSLRRPAAERLGVTIGGKDKITIPGVLLTDERLAVLEAYLSGDGDLPPGGQELGGCPPSPDCPPVENPWETAASTCPPGGTYTREENNCYDSHAHSNAYTREGQYLEGAAAVAAVRAILAEPGRCGCDFESWPTDARWHATQAAAAAPRGRKGAAGAQARQAALLNGRAHLRRPCVLSLAHENGQEVVVRLADGDDPAARRAQLKAMFEGCQAELIAHRAQFECELLLNHGVALDIDCAWLMARALLLIAFDPEKQAPPIEFSLAALVEREFGRVRDKRVRDRDWRLESSLDTEAVNYCRQDAHDALELSRVYRARLEAAGLWDGYRLIQQAILPSCALNLSGVAFDAEAHRALTVHLRNRAARLGHILDQICEGAIRNHDSPQQVGKWIIDQVLAGDHADDPNRIGNFEARLSHVTGNTWKVTKKAKNLAITKGVKARQARALEPHYPIVARYLRASALRTQVTKLAGSFGEVLTQWVDPDGRLRGQLTAGATITLRHNAQHPPVQEMPRRKSFRRLFRAPRGRRLAGCDYSQIELRLAAIIAKDEALLDVYRRGVDVHKAVAANVDLPRSQAKPVSFTMIYAGGAAKIAESAGVSPEKAQAVLHGFLSAYPGIAAYRESAPREAQEAGFIAIQPGRRVRYDPAISKPPQAVNYPIQGGAASIQMLALRRVYDVLVAQPWLDTRLVGAIHDEILLEAPADERADIAAGILQHEMRQALLEIFPESEAMGADRLAEAEILSSWADKS